MNADRDRDRLLEDALRHELRGAGAPPATDACLDAEIVAAWADGGLDPASLAMAEAHASNCTRCQALLGTLARTTPAVAAAELPTARLWRWWFAPLAAAAAAVTVWMVVPQQPVMTPASEPLVVTSPAAREAAKNEPAPATVPLAELRELGRNRADAPPPSEVAARKPGAPASGALERRKEESTLADTAVAGRVAAAAPPAMAQRAQSAEATEAEVTARSSPSPDVIWTVGRAGTVRLATDGRTFIRVPFPETVDLTAVTATDDRHAVVTTADGRTFQTADGGRTWTRP